MENKTELEKKIKELEEAKKNAQTCLDNGECLVDMCGLSYWASRVETLRKEIKKLLQEFIKCY